MRKGVYLLGSFLLVLLATGLVRADDRRGAFSGVDSLELHLELTRHARLATVKRNPENSMAPFTTDGCSGGLSVGWATIAGKIERFYAVHGTRPPWESCCIAHDRLYHSGGSKASTDRESFDARKDADLALKQCVFQTGATRAPELAGEYGLATGDIRAIYEVVAALMYRAVRIGGIPCSGLPWCWGYGWPECN